MDYNLQRELSLWSCCLSGQQKVKQNTWLLQTNFVLPPGPRALYWRSPRRAHVDQLLLKCSCTQYFCCRGHVPYSPALPRSLKNQPVTFSLEIVSPLDLMRMECASSSLPDAVLGTRMWGELTRSNGTGKARKVLEWNEEQELESAKHLWLPQEPINRQEAEETQLWFLCLAVGTPRW